MNKFTNEGYQDIKNISGLKISPDQRYAFYTVRSMDLEKDRYKSNIWLLDIKKEKEVQLTAGDQEGGGVWLDNEHVLFSANRSSDVDMENNTAFFAISVLGGEAKHYMTIPVAGASLTPLGEDRFLVFAMADRNQEEEKQNKNWRFYGEYPFNVEGMGYASRQRRSIFLWDNQTQELSLLTDPLLQTSFVYFSDDVVLSKDGFYFSGYYIDPDRDGVSGVYKYCWDTGETKQLFAGNFYIFSMVRKNDRIWAGTWINKGKAVGNMQIVSADDDGDTYRVEATPEWNLETVKQSNDGVVFIKTFQARSEMCVWGGEKQYRTCSTPDINPVDAEKIGNKILFMGRKSNRLPEVYLYEDGNIRQLSDQNKKLFEEYKFSGPEPLSVKHNGFEIFGWVIKPVDYQTGKKYPAILNMHGGPHGYYNDAFNSEHQRWANEGYFVFYCNPQGSVSYGIDFAEITGNMGKADYENLMAFTDAVCDSYPDIDAKRLAVTGQSYGGYMTNWIIGQTDRFRAAVPRISISNWISMHGTSGEKWYADTLIASTPWENLEKVWLNSPLCYVDKVKTPTLFIQHEKDNSCPLEQAEQMFTALLERGVPTKMMVNLGVGHGGRKVSQMTHDIDVMMEWFSEWLN